MLLERLVEGPTLELTSRLSRVAAAQARWHGVEARITGLIVFSPDSVD
jgi:hypothetical protein